MAKRGLTIGDIPAGYLRDQALQQLGVERIPKQPRGMNKTEAAYERHLVDERSRGRIFWFGFECVTLKLAENRCRYTPDFCVVLASGEVEFHEVKGFWRDDARVKIKVAATTFKWARFVAVTKNGFTWDREEFG